MTADVTSLHVQEHRGQQQSVFGRNHRGSAHMLDPRELAERNLRAAWRRDKHLAEHLRVGAIFRRVPDANRKSPSPLDRGGQRCLADRGLNDLLHISDADAVASRGGTVDLDIEVLAARHSVWAPPGACPLV